MNRYRPYPNYKPSGVAWLGDVPATWQTKRFKFLFQINKRIAGQLGYSILSITQKGIKIKDTESGDGQLSMDYSKYQLVFEGDFAMNHMDLLTGYVDISKFNGVTSPDYRVFSLKELSANARYYLYLLQHCYVAKIFYPLGQGAATIGRWRLPTDAFNDFVSPFPSLNEQTAIAEFLDTQTAKIDTLIAKQQQMIALLKEKRSAVISHAVTRGLNPDVPMKPSGVAWLGDVPAHWVTGALKYFSNIVLGKMLTPNNNGSMVIKPYLRAKNIQWLEVQTDDVNEMWFGDSELKSLKLEKDDLLVSEGGEVGRTCIWNNELDECYIQNSVNRVRVHSGNSRYYLYQFFSAGKSGHFEAIVNRISIAHLTKEKLGDVRFAIAPAAEQTAIAEFLDTQTAKIDTLIAKQQQMIALLKEKRSAVISHTVTRGLNPDAPMKPSGVAWLGDVPEHWETRRSRFIFKFSKGLTITKADLLDEGIPCINYGEIHSKYGFEFNPISNPLKSVAMSFIENSNECLLSKGNFVFADTSEDIEGSGNFSLLNKDELTFAGYHTIIAKAQADICSKFFAYVFDSNSFRTQVQTSVKGVKVFSISQAILKDAFVWFPKLDEQTTIAEFLDTQTAKIDTLITKAEQAISLLQERRSALISAAVTGKIDVRSSSL